MSTTQLLLTLLLAVLFFALAMIRDLRRQLRVSDLSNRRLIGQIVDERAAHERELDRLARQHQRLERRVNGLEMG